MFQDRIVMLCHVVIKIFSIKCKRYKQMTDFMAFYENLFNESFPGNFHICPLFSEDHSMSAIHNVLAFPKLLSD